MIDDGAYFIQFETLQPHVLSSFSISVFVGQINIILKSAVCVLLALLICFVSSSVPLKLYLQAHSLLNISSGRDVYLYSLLRACQSYSLMLFLLQNKLIFQFISSCDGRSSGCSILSCLPLHYYSLICYMVVPSFYLLSFACSITVNLCSTASSITSGTFCTRLGKT